MTTKTIAPAHEDVDVLRPDGRKLAPAGETVTWSTYWARRLKDGDIIIVVPGGGD